MILIFIIYFSKIDMFLGREVSGNTQRCCFYKSVANLAEFLQIVE